MTSPLDFCMLCGRKPSRPDGDFCSNHCYLETREAIAEWKKHASTRLKEFSWDDKLNVETWKKQEVDEHDVPEAMEMQKEMNKGKELK